MKKIRFSDLSEDVRAFLTQAQRGEAVLVEDEQGKPRYGVTAYEGPTEEEWQKAWRDLEQLQQKVGLSMKRQGVSEDDVMKVILEDD